MHFATVFLPFLLLETYSHVQAHARPHQHKQRPSPAPYSYCQAGFPSVDTYPFISSPNATYLSVQLITRHGDRTPVNIMPHDDAVWNACSIYANSGMATSASPHTPHTNQLYLQKRPLISGHNPFAHQLWEGNCMSGQLTDIGIKQHNELGCHLRSIYIDKLQLLSSSYDNTTLYVRSTDAWRTHQTAESLLTGFYPPETRGTNDGDQVIPIHTYPNAIETMYGNQLACPSLAALSAEMCTTSQWQKHLTDAHDLITKMSQIFGVDPKSSWGLSFDHFTDNLRARECHGLPRPCMTTPLGARVCVSDDDASRVYAGADWEYAYKFSLFNQTGIARVGISAFMSTISSLIDAHVTQASTQQPHKPSIQGGGDPIDMDVLPTVAYYSGHDTTIAAVLGALGITGWRWPEYASNLIIELLHDGSRSRSRSRSSHLSHLSPYYIRVLYQGDLVKLPFCATTECDYQYEWISYMQKIIPDDIINECQQQIPNGGPYCL